MLLCHHVPQFAIVSPGNLEAEDAQQANDHNLHPRAALAWGEDTEEGRFDTSRFLLTARIGNRAKSRPRSLPQVPGGRVFADVGTSFLLCLGAEERTASCTRPHWVHTVFYGHEGA